MFDVIDRLLSNKNEDVTGFPCLSPFFFNYLMIPFDLFLQAVADIIRTTLGPQSMLKMLLDAAGGARLNL